MPDLHELLERSAADYTPPPDLRARVNERSRRRQRNRRVSRGLAAVLAVAGIVGVLPRLQAPAGPVVSEQPPAIDFPALTATFVSPRNGFSVQHPERVAVTPAEQLWGFSEQVDDGFDVIDTGSAAVFKGTSTEVPDSIDDHVSEHAPGGCGVPRNQQAELTVDGHPGRIAECPNHIEATVVAGGRLYLFILSHDRGDARAVFDAFASTIDLTPETAVDVPGLTTTFVSPTYGYSFRYHDRGGLVPATERWDPTNQPIDDRDFDDRFDAVETGSGAYFQAASTEIPDGVPIDAWADEYVSSGGCREDRLLGGPRPSAGSYPRRGVPRAEQARITIDGQPGRISECTGQIEATVVAGGRLYLFRMSHGLSDARAWFDAWVATIDLTPETAAVR